MQGVDLILINPSPERLAAKRRAVLEAKAAEKSAVKEAKAEHCAKRGPEVTFVC